MTDTRNPDQHASDVANAALATVARLMDDARVLAAQTQILGNYLHEKDDVVPDYLIMANTLPYVLGAAREVLRDIASRLPIRDLDWSDE